jgi:uncharacterized protein
VLTALTDVWDTRRSEVEEQAVELAQAILSRSTITDGSGSASLFSQHTGLGDSERVDLLTPVVDDLARRFDATWGGFGPAPKFPQPTLVDLVLTQAQAHPGTAAGASALGMAVTTLDAMAAGGIHDHLGGGFSRYSTDDQWLVPHFEKMLYDQAGLLRAFLHGWQVTGREDYLGVVEGIIHYVERDLTHPSGGIYSAEDADSEGVEGQFYVWTPAQVSDVITDRDLANQLRTFFDVGDRGNFEGATILRRPMGAPLRGNEAVERGRQLLFEHRSTRVRPGLDHKVLTEWNAMYGSALAEAAMAVGEESWATQAIAVGQFLVDQLLGPDGRWMRSWQEGGGARHLAYASDYAWLIDCFTRLGELTG